MEWLSPITQAFVRAAALSLGIALSPAVAIASTEAPGQYFLVIDHSGSMLTPISKGPEAGRSRWNLMRERAADFVDRLPAGADVWAIVFSAQDPSAPDRHWNRIISARLDSPARRDSVTALLKGYPEPGLANGTWLYQATNAALDQVEIAGSRDPDAYLTVLVYTDGVDEGHGRTRAEMLRNPGSQVTRAQTETRIRALRQRYRNFNVVNVYQPGDESIRDAQVIRLLTNRLQLASPLVLPRQELTIALSFRDSEHLRLVGRPVTLSVETEDGRGLPLRILGAPFRLSNAPMKVVVERAGDWPAGRDVEARLSIGYPELPGVLLVAEGGNTSKLFIQGAEAPSIRDLLPASNAVFPVGREVTFSLTTLPEARVDWDFGDGRSATGNPVTHTFTEPGKRTVSVKVTDPRTQLTASATVQLGLAKIAIGLDPFPAAVVPQREVTLTASAEGNFARFEWNVGGRLFAGKPRADGAPGTSLAVTFDRAGPVAVSVAGEGINGGRVEAPPATLEVKEVPALRVTSPADRDALYFDSTREFRAEVEGIRAERVRFTLLSSAGEVILESKEVDVQQQGPLRVAVVEQVIPRLSGRVAGVLRAETVGAEPALRRDIPVVIEREPVIVEIMLPDGREPHIHRPTSMRLRANATLEQVRWDFGEGDGFVDGAEVEQHVWKAYGDYVLRAVARDPEGNEIEAPPIAIKVPVRPVAARAVLVYDGAAVGVDTARVPLNATLGLQADVVGDVLRVRWLLDGEELPAGTETITTTKRGVRELRLIAEGTSAAGNSESVLQFRTSDPFAFWSGLALLVLGTGVAGWLLLGNAWRFAEFKVRTEGASWDDRNSRGEPQPDGAERRLGGPASRRCGRWNALRKQALLSMELLDNKLYAMLQREPNAPNFRWQVNDRIEFKGLETPKPLGRLSRIAIKPRGSRRQLNPGSRQPWLCVWEMVRPGMPPRSPYETVAIFMRLRQVNFLQRYWPEGLFVVVCLLAVLIGRYLHITYF